MILSKLQATNERLDEISADMGELTKSIEFAQDQLDGEIDDVRKKKEKLDKNIKYVDNDLLDPETISSNP